MTNSKGKPKFGDEIDTSEKHTYYKHFKLSHFTDFEHNKDKWLFNFSYFLHSLLINNRQS